MCLVEKYVVYTSICAATGCSSEQFFFSRRSFFRSLTCMIMPLLLSAAKIFMAIIHQQDSCRENSVCSPALNELTFHEAPVFIDELLRDSESFFRQRWRQAEFTQLNTQTKGFG